MEILRELSEEELDYIVNRLEEELPYTIKDVYFILASRRSKKLFGSSNETSAKLFPVFYTHRNGKKENCTIFGITGEQDHNVWLFTFQENLEELKECLEETKLIRWDVGVCFVTTHRLHAKPILDFIISTTRQCNNEEAAFYWLPKDEIQKFKIEIPNDLELKPLREDDGGLCKSLWKFQYENSELYIKSLIRLNGGLGLFDKSTNELLSYGLVNDHLATGMLNTVEHARGKGYAELISKLIAIKIVQNFDINPTVYIDNTKLPSMKLFIKLGYKKVGECNWTIVEKRK